MSDPKEDPKTEELVRLLALAIGDGIIEGPDGRYRLPSVPQRIIGAYGVIMLWAFAEDGPFKTRARRSAEFVMGIPWLPTCFADLRKPLRTKADEVKYKAALDKMIAAAGEAKDQCARLNTFTEETERDRILGITEIECICLLAMDGDTDLVNSVRETYERMTLDDLLRAEQEVIKARGLRAAIPRRHVEGGTNAMLVDRVKSRVQRPTLRGVTK